MQQNPAGPTRGAPMPLENRGGYSMNKAQMPEPKQSVYLPPINKYQAPA